MGKRKVTNEENLENMLFPTKNDVLGMAVKMLGFDQILVKCQDGKERLCRVRGKLKRRVWVRIGGVVLVPPWDSQSDRRGDIFWWYRKIQTEQLGSKATSGCSCVQAFEIDQHFQNRQSVESE